MCLFHIVECEKVASRVHRHFLLDSEPGIQDFSENSIRANHQINGPDDRQALQNLGYNP